VISINIYTFCLAVSPPTMHRSRSFCTSYDNYDQHLHVFMSYSTLCQINANST